MYPLPTENLFTSDFQQNSKYSQLCHLSTKVECKVWEKRTILSSAALSSSQLMVYLTEIYEQARKTNKLETMTDLSQSQELLYKQSMKMSKTVSLLEQQGLVEELKWSTRQPILIFVYSPNTINQCTVSQNGPWIDLRKGRGGLPPSRRLLSTTL